MKKLLTIVAAACIAALAATDVVVAPQPGAAAAPANNDVVSSLDAITIPQMLSYQGKLTDTLGVPVVDTTYSVNFRLYTVPSGGSSFWNETQVVRTRAGLFSALLGSATPIGSMPDAGALYLGMAVGGGAELSPRLRIVSAAYAYLTARAANSDLLQGKDTTGFVRTGQPNSVTSAMVTDATIAAADLGQMGAGSGQVMKWTGSAWAPRNDSVGQGGAGTVTSVSQATGVVCAPNPITTTGTVGFDQTYGDGRYVNEGQAGAITGAMITDGEVSSADIRDTTVNTSELKDGSVTSAKILDGTVARTDVAAGFKAPFSDTADYARAAPAVDSARVAANAHRLQTRDTTYFAKAVHTHPFVDSARIAAGSHRLQGKDTTGFVRTGQTNAITSAMVVDGTIVRGDVAAGFKAPFSDTADYARAAPAVDSARVAANSHKLQGKDTTELDARYVNEGQAGSVTGAMIADGEVSSADIRDTTVNTVELKDAAVTAPKLNQMGATANQVLKWTGSAWTPRNDSLGTSDNAWVRVGTDSVLYTVRQLGIARGGAANMLHGTLAYTHVNLGVSCTTGWSGQNYSTTVVSGGVGNVAGNIGATVGGGTRNLITGVYATVPGGFENSVSGQYATITGGRANVNAGNYGVVGGYLDTLVGAYCGVLSGYDNNAGSYSFDTAAVVAGGRGNRATLKYSTVGGGNRNTADGSYAVVAGGYMNATGTAYDAIGGGYMNTTSGAAGCATIGGGAYNVVSRDFAVVAGGENDSAMASFSGALSGFGNVAGDAADDTAAVVAGGWDNSATGRYSAVGGGRDNNADTTYATVGGGDLNSAEGRGATVGGGINNDATQSTATVGGGSVNSASGEDATVSGGYSNAASGQRSTVGGGWSNIASGRCATVPGGCNNVARGGASSAAGYGARANHRGTFVWSDSSASVAESVYTTGADQFRVRARGGTWFFSNAGMSSGAYLAAGSNSWASACDRANKTDFRPVDRQELLRRVATLPVSNYRMKDQHDGTRHVGPVAQDFAAAFGVGENNTSINMADADGVLLAAVQALYEQSQAQQAEIEALKAELRRR